MTRAKSATLLAASALLALTLLGGCPTAGPTPTFVAGDSDEYFGQANDQAGNVFDIFLNDNNEVQVVASGSDGDVNFTLDEQGRVTSAAADDGSSLVIQYNDDGSAWVIGTVVIEGTPQTFSSVAPAGALPNTKDRAAAQGRDPLLVCVAVDAFCDLLPTVIDEVINAFAQQLIDEIGLGDLVPDDFSFPTGVALVDDQLREQVRIRFPIIVQLEGFCTVWELLDLNDFCAAA